MTKQGPIRAASIFERAAEVYDFGAALRRQEGAEAVEEPYVEPFTAPPAPMKPRPARSARTPAPIRSDRAVQAIDRVGLAQQGFVVPGAAVGPLAEEFRIVKRQLLLAAEADPAARTILICSAQPDEGKTFCAINLALSIASERDVEVLLVDADLAKPDVMAQLGVSADRGLMDAIADPALDVEDLIVATDLPRLSLLSAGRRTVDDTEYLASARTATVIARLLETPGRIVILDSPPALAASAASVLALHVGQALVVVRADRTSETELRDALSVLGGCERIQLLLNDVSFTPGGRRFGAYYGRDG